MNDTLFAIFGLPFSLAVTVALVFTAYRRARPYKVVGHNYGTGMVAIRWRDEPDRTYWVTPATLQNGPTR